VDRFERDLECFTGAKHAVAVVNGTAALHVALIVAGVKASDEVLIPSLSFVATANAVMYCGGRPHFIDSEERTLGVDAVKLREYLQIQTEQRAGQCINRATGKVIRALVPMHTFGHPADLERLIAVSRDFNIILVEDAAESLGSYYHGQHTGTFGTLGALSFNGNKTVTTGGGGALLTNSSELAGLAKHLTTTAKLAHAWDYRHDAVGYNYRMPNLNAALGCAQMEQLPKMLIAKRELFKRYKSVFSKILGVALVDEPSNCKSNFWLQTLLLDLDRTNQRDLILSATNSVSYKTRPAWILLHELSPFKECLRMDLSGAHALSGRLINIPSSARLAS
jgi:aminotransferase in exopolysaccharide biosynthesis